MGEFALGKFGTVCGWISAIVLIILNLYTIYTAEYSLYMWVIIFILSAVYFIFIGVVVFAPVKESIAAHKVMADESGFK